MSGTEKACPLNCCAMPGIAIAAPLRQYELIQPAPYHAVFSTTTDIGCHDTQPLCNVRGHTAMRYAILKSVIPLEKICGTDIGHTAIQHAVLT
eukprot:1921638-Rhodomonas_salina.1